MASTIPSQVNPVPATTGAISHLLSE
jgi:hypothetical protein